MTETHMMYWELFPSIDHIHPVAKGGGDSENNLVTTSMIKNMAKSNYTLDKIGWILHEPGNLNDWGGLIGMFRTTLENKSELRRIQYIKTWENALKRGIKLFETEVNAKVTKGDNKINIKNLSI